MTNKPDEPGGIVGSGIGSRIPHPEQPIAPTTPPPKPDNTLPTTPPTTPPTPDNTLPTPPTTKPTPPDKEKPPVPTQLPADTPRVKRMKEISTRLGELIAQYGGESNVPVTGNEYWNLKREMDALRSEPPA